MSFTGKDIERIRAKIVADYPLFSSFMFGLEMEENENIKTLCVTMTKMTYNSTFMEAMNPAYQLISVLHELTHVFLGHPLRIRPEHDKERINRSADYAANSLLKDYGIEIPWNFLWDQRYTGMAMEEVYSILETRRQPPLKRGHGSAWSGDKNGECKSQEQEDKHNNRDKTDEGKSASAEQKKKEQEHKQRQTQAIQQAKMMGKLPGSLKRTLDKMVESKTDWRQALPDLLEDITGMDDYTYAHTDRRYDGEIILPGMVGKKQGTFVLAIDTSGSIDGPTLSKMGSEVMEIIVQNDPERTYIIWVDASIRSVQVVEGVNVPTLEPKGGGGTSFVPPFNYVEGEGIEPTTLIYLTDGFCNRFAPQPNYPVIWVVWQDTHTFKPPYGTVVAM